MTVGQTSGNYNFANQTGNIDILFDAWERLGKLPAEITQQQLVSSRRSLNFLLQSFANGKGPMLWAVPEQPLTILLQQGISSITLPPYVSSVLDCYVRQYINITTVNLAVSLTTNIGQTSVNVYQPNHGLLPGQQVFFVTPVSIGGLIIQGLYIVSNVPDQNDFTITTATPATASATSTGLVPQFTTSNGTANVAVTLPSHGLSAGNGFNVPLSTTVGGITLYGSYYVTSVTNANVFIINSTQTATSGQSIYLNSGQMQVQEQSSNSVPTDRLLTPMSRTDYSALPYKAQQGFPYTYWNARVQPQTMTLWQTPDGNGPYYLNVYYLRQLQDANLGGGEIPDVQYRALEMLTSKLAAKLAIKFAADKYALLKADADEEMADFELENREKVSIHIMPEVSRYYRGN